MTLTIDIIPMLQDNYSYLVYNAAGKGFVVDPAEAQPILTAAKNKSIRIEFILNTHYHWDHTDGNADITKETGAHIIAPFDPKNRISDVSQSLKEGDVFDFHGHIFQAISTPCHTSDHMCFYNRDQGILFSGDTLFSLGCGRFFEGTAQDMFAAFDKLRALPDDTQIYCGHEYTQSNAAFALHIDPDNAALVQRVQQVKSLRDQNLPSLPIDLGTEKQTNPFLRAKNAQDLATLRALKDQF